MTDLAIWERSGDPTVLLIHGLTGNSRWWTNAISYLPDHLGYVAPDLRGRGDSWNLSGPYGIRRHADDLANLIRERDLGPMVVAGYSMGAWVATTLATGYSDLLKGVVAIDGGLRINYPDGLSDSEAIEQVVGASVAALSLEFESESEYLNNWREHPAIAPYLDSIDLTPLTYSLGGEEPHLVVRASGEAVLQDGGEFLVDETVVKAVQRVECPTTLITVSNGMADTIGGFISETAVTEAIAANPGIRVRHLDGLNHYTLMLTPGARYVANEIVAMTHRGQKRT